VDTEGFLIEAKVTNANKSDSHGFKILIRRKKVKALKKLWADNAYQGQDNQQKAKEQGIDLEIVKRPSGRIRTYDENLNCVWVPVKRVFSILPRRWVVERTFAWIGRYRRMSKDYEFFTRTSETMIYLAMTKTMLTRYSSTT
jgi:transposase